MYYKMGRNYVTLFNDPNKKPVKYTCLPNNYRGLIAS